MVQRTGLASPQNPVHEFALCGQIMSGGNWVSISKCSTLDPYHEAEVK